MRRGGWVLLLMLALGLPVWAAPAPLPSAPATFGPSDDKSKPEDKDKNKDDDKKGNPGPGGGNRTNPPTPTPRPTNPTPPPTPAPTNPSPRPTPPASQPRPTPNPQPAPQGGTPRPQDDGNTRRSFYGQVTFSSGSQLQSGDTRIKSDSRWLSVAAPGMWLEASGYWEGDTFIADEIRLHVPQNWAYYQGPSQLVGAKDYQYVEAWLTTSNKFMALKTAPSSNQVRVVAYYDGKKLRAVPASLPLPPANTPTGWVELMGTVGSGGVVWVSAKAFP